MLFNSSAKFSPVYGKKELKGKGKTGSNQPRSEVSEQNMRKTARRAGQIRQTLSRKRQAGQKKVLRRPGRNKGLDRGRLSARARKQRGEGEQNFSDLLRQGRKKIVFFKLTFLSWGDPENVDLGL